MATLEERSGGSFGGRAGFRRDDPDGPPPGPSEWLPSRDPKRGVLAAGVLACAVALIAFVGDVGTFSSPPPAPQNFYVATTGNDSNPGTIGSPWLTAAHAAAYLRSNVLATQKSEVDVNFAAGDYGPFGLTDLDSGQNGYQVVYRCNATIATCRFVGGTPVTGWVTYSGSIQKTHLSGSCPQVIWENDVAARKARFPAYVNDGTHPLAFAPYLLSEGVASSSTVLQYTSGDLTPGSWPLTDAQIFIWSGGSGRAWFTDTIPITSINTGTRQITLAHPTRYTIETGSRYYAQGVLSFLVGPGQFFCDSAAGDLYYWPNSTPIASQTIVVPTVQDVVTMLGADSTHRVSNVTIDGFAVQYSDFTTWYRDAWPNDGDSGEGHFYPQYDRVYTLAQDRHGAIRMENTDHVTLQRLHIKNAGFSGVFMRQYNQRDAILNSWIEKVGHSSIYVDGNYPAEGYTLRTNVYRNLRLNDFGQLAGSGAGIALTNSGNNYARNLDVYNGPRYGIFAGAYQDATILNSDLYARDNVFQFLKLHALTQDSGDTACLYTFGFDHDGAGPWIINNFDQGTIDGCLAHASMTDIAPTCIFADGGSSGTTYSNFKVTNCGTGTRNGGGVTATYTNVTSSATVDTGNIGTDLSFPFP